MSLTVRRQSASAIGQMRPRKGRGNNLWSQQPTVSITPVERAGRILIGLAAILVGAQLHSAGTWPLAAALEMFLFATGLDLYLTGALGIGPMFYKLGYTRRAARRLSSPAMSPERPVPPAGAERP